RLDPDRVDAALLTQDDPALGTDELGRVRLDRRWIVELRGDCAGLAPEQVLADEWRPRRELVAAQLPHAPRHLDGLREVEACRVSVQRLERERDLRQVRVARTLAHPVDRPVKPLGPGLHRRYGSGGGEA